MASLSRIVVKIAIVDFIATNNSAHVRACMQQRERRFNAWAIFIWIKKAATG
jgi:hypothetical protein